MTKAEILALKATARAKMEDLLGRTASREMSSEEKQLMADLQAEGQRLSGLEVRYAALESFDNGGQPTQIVRTPVTPVQERLAQMKALDFAFRTGKFQDGKQASDVPLQIEQSPVDAGAAGSVPTDVAGLVDGIGAFDLPAALGCTEYPRSSSNPLKVPILGSAVASAVYQEGDAPDESTPPTFKTVTLGGARYQNLTKVSIESINNVAFNVVAAVTRALAIGQLESQNTAFMAELKAACQANTHCFVGGGGGQDAHGVLTRLITGLPAIWQGAGNKFLLSSSALLGIMDDRDTQGRPLVDVSAGTLMGRPYVLSDDADRIYFGNFAAGVLRSRTPMFVSVLRELYAEKGHIGYSSYQFADWATYAELTSLTKQPVVFCNRVDTAGS